MTQLTKTDIQFNGSDATSAKLRRLVEALQTAQAAINTLSNTVATLNGVAEQQQQLLATVTGLGPDFYVKGLTPGQVLQAISATNAAFQKLNLSQLGDVSVPDPLDGQILTRFHNQWISANPQIGAPTKAVNIGTGEAVYAGIESNALAFRSITGDGSTTTVTEDADTITISAPQSDDEMAEADAMAFLHGY
jgi:hypothetical protein